MLASLSLVLLSLASSSLAAVTPSADVAAAAGVPASNNIVITKPHFHAPAKPMSRFAKHRPHRRSVVAERSKTSNSTKTEDVEKKTSSDSGYKIAEHWAGSTFFDDWTFYDSSDPTHGNVEYVSESTAKADKLAYVEDGVAYMKVDSTSNLSGGKDRKSVRIHSSKTFNGGLFIADIKHMPTGAATWPAFWTVGHPWPNHGEIDIIETIGTNNQNQYTVHSASGCEIDTSSTAPKAFRVAASISSVLNKECVSGQGHNSGCAFVDESKASAGAPFNAAGGGTYAMEWTSDGIKIFFFPRAEEPSDIASQAPNPDGWETKYLKAAWSSHSCDTKKFFQSHAVTFNIDLCGDWAGSAYPGGKSKCAEYVKTGSHFKEAYWAINSVSVYQS